ncbi:MAG: DUF167 family protein [Planctomycetia bacterium]
MAAAGPLAQAPDGRLLLQVKVVPGAASEGVAGALGERLKVRVAAPPAAGAANAALLRLLARALGCPQRDLALVAGAGTPRKTVAIRGVALGAAGRALGLA